MEFLCSTCKHIFASRFVPAMDLGARVICPSCEARQKSDFWARNLIFSEDVRMTDLPNGETW